MIKSMHRTNGEKFGLLEEIDSYKLDYYLLECSPLVLWF